MGHERERKPIETDRSKGQKEGTTVNRHDESKPMSQQRLIKILSVDGDHLIREGIAALIGSQTDMQLIAHASSGIDAIQLYRQRRPDITLMELRLPGLSGLDATTEICAEFPEARIIILTAFDGDVEVQRALEAGARGYFLKSLSPDELVKAIRDVHAGKKRIQTELAARMVEHMGEDRVTAREIQVLEHVAAGQRNREIGERLFIAEETVKVHLRHIMEKLGARDRTHAVAIANRRGVVRL
jgi:DNA-binding NarL/FixJ family response regulator